jgi:hypothetical protein
VGKAIVLVISYSNTPTVMVSNPGNWVRLAVNLNNTFMCMSSGCVQLAFCYDHGCIYWLDFPALQGPSHTTNGMNFLTPANTYTLTHPNVSCHITQLEWDSYQHYIVSMPQTDAGFSGRATMLGNWVLLNSRIGVTIQTSMHKLGHNMGLPHASHINVIAQSTWFKYGNQFNQMGTLVTNSLVFLTGYRQHGLDHDQGLLPA